jgi:mono/diheme cytochrome c family protein
LKRVSILLVALSWVVAVTFAWADDGAEALFKQQCGVCHMKGGEAAPVNPGDKAARVWVKYFKRDRHPVTLNIPEESMDVLVEYLEDHAADSDQPQMLAIPR